MNRGLSRAIGASFPGYRQRPVVRRRSFSFPTLILFVGRRVSSLAGLQRPPEARFNAASREPARCRFRFRPLLPDGPIFSRRFEPGAPEDCRTSTKPAAANREMARQWPRAFKSPLGPFYFSAFPLSRRLLSKRTSFRYKEYERHLTGKPTPILDSERFTAMEMEKNA